MAKTVIKIPLRALGNVIKHPMTQAIWRVIIDADDPPDAPAPQPVESPTPQAARVPVSVSYETTPNPNALKFNCSIPVVTGPPLAFHDQAEAKDSVLGNELFSVPGVQVVFAVSDFVTITKDTGARWPDMTPAIQTIISTVLSEHGTLPS